jgi:kynurenine formamidase
LSEDGAKWLVTRKPKAVGVDFFEEYSARLKDFKPDDFVVHKIILGAGIIIIEHLTNLNKVSKERVKLYILPLKLMISEAAPARAIAIEE